MAFNLPLHKSQAQTAVSSELGVFATYPVRPEHDFIIPENVRGIQVLEGVAWVVSGGNDFVLFPGEMLTFKRSDAPIVAALYDAPCVIDLLHN